MKSFVILALMSLLFVSCSKEDIKTKAANLVTTNVTNVVVTSLECTNADVVKADVAAQVNKLFKIEAETASVGATFCNTVVDIVVPQLIAAGIPATWGCTATAATADVVALAKKGCDKL